MKPFFFFHFFLRCFTLLLVCLYHVHLGESSQHNRDLPLLKVIHKAPS